MMRKALTAVLVLTVTTAWAQERPRAAQTASKASLSQEQPKVLYIVPWQAPTNPELKVPEPSPSLQGSFKPLERDFYRQSLYFRQHLKLGALADNP